MIPDHPEQVVTLPTNPAPNSQIRGTDYGVLKFTLGAGTDSWQFIPVAGSTFRLLKIPRSSGQYASPSRAIRFELLPGRAPEVVERFPFESALEQWDELFRAISCSYSAR